MTGQIPLINGGKMRLDENGSIVDHCDVLQVPSLEFRQQQCDVLTREVSVAIDDAFFETWTPRALAVLRIVTAYLLIPHGTAKLFGMPHQAMFDGLQL